MFLQRLQRTTTNSKSTCIITDPVKSFFWASYIDCSLAEDDLDTPEAMKRFAESYVNYAGSLVFTGAREHTPQVKSWGAWAWNSIVSAYLSGSVHPPLFPNLNTVIIGHCVKTELNPAELYNIRSSKSLDSLSWSSERKSYAQHLFNDALKVSPKQMCYHAHDIAGTYTYNSETIVPALSHSLPPHLTVHCSLATIPKWNTANQTTPCSQTWYVSVPTKMRPEDQTEKLQGLCEAVWQAMLPRTSAEPVESVIFVDKGYAGEELKLNPDLPSLHPDTRIRIVTEGDDGEDGDSPRCTLCTDSFCTRSET